MLTTFSDSVRAHSKLRFLDSDSSKSCRPASGSVTDPSLCMRMLCFRPPLSRPGHSHSLPDWSASSQLLLSCRPNWTDHRRLYCPVARSARGASQWRSLASSWHPHYVDNSLSRRSSCFRAAQRRRKSSVCCTRYRHRRRAASSVERRHTDGSQTATGRKTTRTNRSTSPLRHRPSKRLISEAGRL